MAKNVTVAAVLLLALAFGAQAETMKLRLTSGETLGSKGGNSEAIGTTAVYEYALTCASTGNSTIGSCHETGIYLSPPKTGRQMVIWQLTCDITQKCGEDVGVGKINSMGMAPAGDWTGQFPITFSIVGGTGAYEGVTGGSATFINNDIDLVLIKP